MHPAPSHWAPHLRPETVPPPHPQYRNPSTIPPPIPPLFSLPRELRDQIYTYLTPHSLSFTMQNQNRVRNTRFQRRIFIEIYFLAVTPALLVNHQLRSELLSSIYAHTTFSFDWRRRSNFILECLTRIPRDAKAQIRSLEWKEWSLHTGGETRTVKGWDNVFHYIDEHFLALRVVHCHSPSTEDGRHRYHNWEIPRLAIGLLVRGRIEEVRWYWDGFIYTLAGVGTERMCEMARALFEIPRVEEEDKGMGMEFRRLLCDEGELGGGEVDEWARRCRRRERNRLSVRRTEDCLVVRRGV